MNIFQSLRVTHLVTYLSYKRAEVYRGSAGTGTVVQYSSVHLSLRTLSGVPKEDKTCKLESLDKANCIIDDIDE